MTAGGLAKVNKKTCSRCHKWLSLMGAFVRRVPSLKSGGDVLSPPTKFVHGLNAMAQSPSANVLGPGDLFCSWGPTSVVPFLFLQVRPIC